MRLVLVLAVLAGALAPAEAATSCRSTTMGSTTYTTCEGKAEKTKCRSHWVGGTTYTQLPMILLVLVLIGAVMYWRVGLALPDSLLAQWVIIGIAGYILGRGWFRCANATRTSRSASSDSSEACSAEGDRARSRARE